MYVQESNHVNEIGKQVVKTRSKYTPNARNDVISLTGYSLTPISFFLF